MSTTIHFDEYGQEAGRSDDAPELEGAVTETLSIRNTHKYVGTWKHLDSWTDIGTIEVVGSTTREEDDEDGTEPRVTTMHAIITCDEPTEDTQIERALHETYTSWGCDHEYDCCGCRSFRVTEAKRRTGDLWQVRISSSRNF